MEGRTRVLHIFAVAHWHILLCSEDQLCNEPLVSTRSVAEEVLPVAWWLRFAIVVNHSITYV